MEARIKQFVADDLGILIAIVTLTLVSLVAVAGFGQLAPLIAIIGWFLLTPIFIFWGDEIAVAVFGESEPATATRHEKNDALSELKQRYAEGEIDDREFERRLDRLLQVDDALNHVFTSNWENDGEEAVREHETGHSDRREPSPDIPAEDDSYEWERE